MNKETRQFIFGIICTVMCTLGLVNGITGIHESETTGLLMVSFLFCILELLGIIIGVFFILKNI